ncbi:MAG: hypothetical protein QXL43_00990, partial [Methanolinea sp.]
MRPVIVALLLALLLAEGALAYELVISAPAEVRLGLPIEVTGTTNFPEGTEFDIVLYRIQTTLPEPVAEKTIVVSGSRSFEATFGTIGLSPGDYKVEVRFRTDPGSKLDK